ncbi:MAG TPA: DUF1080 domain-containing protein [Humisphaera sp.]|jgi:hypothetical protein|nr:DUF1080 domain-containing protein [Humisphaera sp.]
MRPLIFIASLLLLSCAAITFSADPPAQPAADAWRSLFNGKDLSDWTPVGRAVWRVEDGVIVGTQDGDASRSGVLDTKEQFQDFEISLDFLLDEHGKYNSGVYLRNQPGTQAQTGYQINIGRGVIGEYCGGLYRDGWRATGDQKDQIRKPREWNSMRILARGPHVEVELNGKMIVNYTDPSPNPAFIGKGVISLQTYGAEGHSGFVKFRNVKIRELPAGSHAESTK